VSYQREFPEFPETLHAICLSSRKKQSLRVTKDGLGTVRKAAETSDP
jgi:hypothetical protein